jgi:hypothetical protein
VTGMTFHEIIVKYLNEQNSQRVRIMIHVYLVSQK